MTKAAKVRKKKRRRRPKLRNSGDGAGNYHSRMHRSKSARQTGFALHDQAEQKKSAHAEPAREKEIQSLLAQAHASSRNQIISSCNPRPPNAVPHFAAPIAPCPGAGSTSRSKQSITKIPIS